MTIKKWWHFNMPKRYWYCEVLGATAPTRKHWTRFTASKEAVRLAEKFGLPVYILRTESVVLPKQPDQAPEYLVHHFGSRTADWYNSPERVFKSDILDDHLSI